MLEIMDNLSPYTFRFSNYHRVTILEGLIRIHRNVNPSHNNFNVSLPVDSCNFVSSVYVTCKSCNTDQICFNKIERVKVLIDYFYLPFCWRCSSYISKPQRRKSGNIT